MKTALVLISAVFSISAIFAQQTIEGQVLDAETNDALIGANVVVEGTSTGTITDFDGKFTLNVPSSAQNIVISYSGYVNQVIPISSGNFNIA